MDYRNDADPMISSSALFNSEYHTFSQHQSSQGSFGVLDFDTYSRPILDEASSVVDLPLDSPESVDICHESDIELGFQDSHSVASALEDESSLGNESPASISAKTSSLEDDLQIKFQRDYVNREFAKHDTIPQGFDTWAKGAKVDFLMALSPCIKYTRDDILNLDRLTDAQAKINMLIDLVEKIEINFKWNHVQPTDEILTKGYTVVADCKKEKKKDADGRVSPKRPMNAFMIWSKKCRSLIAYLAPQLHNALISSKLGGAWKLFTATERAVYEKEKERLALFHKREFPGYKYKPKKKTKKQDAEKPATAAKPKPSRKRKPEKNPPTVTTKVQKITDAHKSLNPQLKERLQVKIDPQMKKGIGKSTTGIHLTALTSFQQEMALSSNLQVTLPVQTTPKDRLVIDDQSSVFDTPGNSPNTPITPVTPTEQILNCYSNASSTRSDTCFDFDDKSMIHYSVENNNNIVLTASSIDNNNIKSEPIMQWCHIKPEPIIKPEPQLVSEPGLPNLSPEAIEECLRGDSLPYNNNEVSPDLTDILSYLVTDTDICDFPEEPSMQFQNMLEGQVDSGLLQCKLEPEEYIDHPAQLHYVPERPATV